MHVTRKMQLSFALEDGDLLVEHKIESVYLVHFPPFSCPSSRLTGVATVFFFTFGTLSRSARVLLQPFLFVSLSKIIRKCLQMKYHSRCAALTESACDGLARAVCRRN